jgi:hypothetical protein
MTIGSQPLNDRLFTGALRAFNALGPVIDLSGLALPSLDPQTLLDAACRKTGLSDFGSPALEPPLEVFLGACRTEANLNLFGRMVTRWDALRLLTNRLRLEEDWRHHPAIADEPIERPLFITGLPRSGSTLLHGLLAQDPDNRCPAHWETMYPSPPPERLQYEHDPRIRQVERQLKWFTRIAPGLKTMHLIGARLPRECTEIMDHVFLSLRLDTVYRVPSYLQWLDRQGLREAYAFHRRFLQQLQWRCPPRRWVLKSPDHVFALADLFAVYPDARVLMTHRDPLRVVGSVASLTAALRMPFSDSVDPAEVAHTVSQRWVEGVRRMAQAREQADLADRFLDIHYLDLLRDPMGEIRRVYSHLGLLLSEEASARMHAFLSKHPKDRHGEHRYSLAQFGLDRDQQERQYRPYVERFQVEPEPARP